MTLEYALAYLRKNQPLPLLQDYTEFSEVVDFLELNVHPSLEIPKLVLGAIGVGDAYGRYMTLDYVLAAYPREEVVEALETVLQEVGKEDYVGFPQEFASDYPDERLYPLLIRAINHGTSDECSKSLGALWRWAEFAPMFRERVILLFKDLLEKKTLSEDDNQNIEQMLVELEEAEGS
jgi:hypothetical protein